MSDVQGRNGVLGLLIGLLLLTCWAADWTDDYHSYAVANRYAVFQAANGANLARPSGGSMDVSAMTAALSARSSAARKTDSALEATFGPLYSGDDTRESDRDSLLRSGNSLMGSSLMGSRGQTPASRLGVGSGVDRPMTSTFSALPQ